MMNSTAKILCPCLPFVLVVLVEAAFFTLFPNIVLFLPNLIYKSTTSP
jgi:TRAP-type C4-dicarboxylate transport system permease large subunit